MSFRCKVCGAASCSASLALPDLPVTNKYREYYSNLDRYPFDLAQCSNCGLIQLIEVVPPEALVAEVDWIEYVEPEPHLDDLTEIIINLDGVDNDSQIMGLSEKDSSLLRRLRERGFCNVESIEKKDVGLKDDFHGLETIQLSIANDWAERIKTKYSRPSVFIARHILEHAHDLVEFSSSLLLLESDYYILEVPDYEYAFKNFIYSTLWEEHVCYFTEDLLEVALRNLGFEVLSINRYEYPVEDCLVAIVKKAKKNNNNIVSANSYSFQSFSQYVDCFDDYLYGIKSILKIWLSEGKKIAMYGTGHVAVMFANIVDFVNYSQTLIDDNSRKIGNYLPGQHIKISGSEALYRDKIDICLLAVCDDAQKKIIQKHSLYLKLGGQFISIFDKNHHIVANCS